MPINFAARCVAVDQKERNVLTLFCLPENRVSTSSTLLVCSENHCRTAFAYTESSRRGTLGDLKTLALSVVETCVEDSINPVRGSQPVKRKPFG
jgi:hypothetical protein